MTLERLVLRSLRHRLLATVLSALSIALGVGLVVGIDTLRREARANFEGAAGTWDLVVGPKGSPMALTLSSLFHLGEATDTMPVSALERLRADPRVALAVPVVLGDRFHEFRVVGTSEDLFRAEARRGVPIRCAEGRPFASFDPAARNFEAVAGATVAAHEGLRPGSVLTAAHGMDERIEGEEHDEAPWTVTGVLAPTGTPLDRVVLVHAAATWAMEGHDATAGRGEGAEPRISSVLVKAANPLLAGALFFEVRSSETLTPARPFLEVRSLLDLVGSADRLLVAVSVLVVVVAALGILVSMISGMRARRRDLAMMRALGAPRRVLAGLMVGEAATTGAFGAGLGLLLGHGIVAAGAAALTEWTGVRVRPTAFAPEEILLFAGAVGICALAGLLPAAAAWRTEVAEGLSGE